MVESPNICYFAKIFWSGTRWAWMRGGLWNKGTELSQVNSCVVKRIMNFTFPVILIKFFSYVLLMISKKSRKLTIRWHGIRGLGTELVKWVVHWYFSIFLSNLDKKSGEAKPWQKSVGARTPLFSLLGNILPPSLTNLDTKWSHLTFFLQFSSS